MPGRSVTEPLSPLAPRPRQGTRQGRAKAGPIQVATLRRLSAPAPLPRLLVVPAVPDAARDNRPCLAQSVANRRVSSECVAGEIAFPRETKQ